MAAISFKSTCRKSKPSRKKDAKSAQYTEVGL
jgi:hypothetical protein